MTHDQFEHHLRRMHESGYAVGYRAGLCGTSTAREPAHFEPVAMDDGLRAGLTEAIEGRKVFDLVT